jgi:hypothetical protein
MPHVTRIGQAGLTGWREKVGERVAPALSRKTPLKEDQARALLGVLFFGLSAMYVGKTLATLSRQIRSR